MEKVKFISVLLFVCVVFSCILPVTTYTHAEESAVCVACHETTTPGIVGQWRSSKHSLNDVECLDCHGASASDPDAFEHGSMTIAIIVSPRDCARCHDQEYRQQKGSHHAKAGQILGSLDNLLGEVVGGMPAVDAGCRQCHGSIVKVASNGRPTSDTWPNTGMGRINPDGSWGACSACHTRHEFSVRQARQPEACGKCHLGPDHPQIEVWNESKHGIMYHASREALNLEGENWRAGREYFVGPTCASCHMSAAGDQEVTHDVGERISWTLRAPISRRLNMVVYGDDTKEDILGDSPAMPQIGMQHTTKGGQGKEVKATLSWQERRARMQAICQQCHNISFVGAAYRQFDEVVLLYNEKFAVPASQIMAELRQSGKITPEDFDEAIEWTWWELWHHEGRRARHGASMQGPDYTWWHGMYEVAKHFYNRFIPEMEKAAGKELAGKLLKKYLYTHTGHEWHRDGMSREALQKVQEFYKKRYGY
jgi:hydroxylamine dehydrogenase